MGRPRTPDSLKRLRGTWRPDRDGKAPQPRPTRPRLSPGLPGDVKAWSERLIRLLRPLRVLTTSDGPIVEATAWALADHARLAADARANGLTYSTTTPTGSVMHRQRPEVMLMVDAWRRGLAGLQALGLSPNAAGEACGIARRRSEGLLGSVPSPAAGREAEQVGRPYYSSVSGRRGFAQAVTRPSGD